MAAALLVSVGPKAVAALALLALGALAARRRSPPGAVLFLFLAALAVRLLLPERAHRVFYDEYEHLDLAWNLASGGVFSGTMALVPGVADVDILPLWPPLAHLHYAALFLARGFSESSVYVLNAVLSSLAVLAAGGVVPAALLAFSSVAVMYSTTADLSSVWLLWTALAWLAVLRTEEDESSFALWSAGLTLAAALHARPDGLLLLPPMLWLLSRHGRRAAGPAGLVLVSAAPLLVLAALARGAGHDGYGDSWASLLSRVPRQAWENALFFLSPARLILVALAAAGLWTRRERRSSRALALSALLYFGLYAAYPTSAFTRGSGDKYALALELPLALLAGGAALPGTNTLLVLYAALSLAGVHAPRDAGYAASDRFLRRAAGRPEAREGRPVLSFVPPAARVVLKTPTAHPILLLEDGPQSLDPEGKGFLVLRDEAWERRPQDAARVDALIRTLYTEETLLSEEAGGRRRLLTRLTPKR